MRSIPFYILLLAVFCLGYSLSAQNVSDVWVADLGNGKYKNPILHADYSDPDICKVGDDFYMTSSSFNAVPGLPILHSKDLVNWKLIGYALDELTPEDHFSKPQHGNGVWAPSIRYHNGEFYIYYGDPDFGIYMVKTKDPAGSWEDPVLVQKGKGLIDPCPLWDKDGKAYLVHAFAGSRAGIKSVLVVRRMSPDGTHLLDEGSIVFDGHGDHPTIEGPKFYKRNGYYYIFAPAGGVPTGWQTILRSKNVFGPYEDKIVLEQGETEINGPHQGGWVELESGESWFVHFQDKEAYGRIVHLQPMKWKNDWPVIGIDKDGDGKGWPVMIHKKPDVKGDHKIVTPEDSDEFNSISLANQWQWHANPKASWAFTNAAAGKLRLYTVQSPDKSDNLWNVPNLLLQKFPAEEFTVTTKLSFSFNDEITNEKIGLVIMGEDYAHLNLTSKSDGVYLSYGERQNARTGGEEITKNITKLNTDEIYLRVTVIDGGKCQFSYSKNGKKFIDIDEVFTARPGRWIGAKVGLFAIRNQRINDSGYADFEWFRFEPVDKEQEY
ncbi:glycoside hydrolase family 43 protein [Mangrovivirga cuniculi]|uniref:Glycoside hydrolase n=1 Tax=Mangrovivirga cuniculi TaxID=2715131 RepID=A0A4D7J9Y2_9BACT|nr:glycoside hydrolase 43 family protein [Mangrovivirga cuniculi]QCK13289.1 glycoside hydrolase [Mangrovivirga cuniculi]